MRNLFFLLIFVFWGIHVHSQNVYFGYPPNIVALKKGDIVILNIPEYTDCRFNNLEEFDNLIKLLKVNESNKLRIEINVIYGDSVMSDGTSRLLCKDFKKILELKTTLKNYLIVSNGNKNPIFSRKDDITDRRMYIMYIKYNSRLEITVE
jgi:hypothetical protein